MQTLEHIAISASAGSGKTFQLTHRFIFLLHQFEAPERVIALTFTRTAAGEFFQKIVRKLAHAASGDANARKLSESLGIEADAPRYTNLLRLFIDRMNRIHLQTLDSFFYRIVSTFALELGVSGNPTLLDETAERRVRNRVRDAILYRSDGDPAMVDEFWEAFKQATYGREERRIGELIADFIDRLYPLFLESPEIGKWGGAHAIWPRGCPWFSTDTDWNQLADNLLQCIPESLTASQQKDFANTAAKIADYPAHESLNTLLQRSMAQASEIMRGTAVVRCGRGKNNSVTLDGALREALAACLRAIMSHHLVRALENTRGVRRILGTYHEQYEQLVRRPGLLSFTDLTYLLAPVDDQPPLLRADPQTREMLDYRLDGRYDHWLFDEFQDTSRPQWNAVANLIDEVVQDTSGTRSFFYVGDTKQCLYLWRNSDDRLFHDVYQRYTPKIRQQFLASSWRSAPPVLNAVNEVFGDAASIADAFSPEVADRWNRAWAVHEPSEDTRTLTGYACWIEANAEEETDRNTLVLDLLHELDPVRRGLRVGVLVRKNAQVTELADFLRSHGSVPVHTGSAVTPASDNAAGAALLAMLQLAAHPGNAMARGFLRMLDASASCQPGLESAAPTLRQRLLRDGFEVGVRWAANLLEMTLPSDDEKHRARLRSLVARARAFDGEQERDLDAGIDFLERTSEGEVDPGDTVVIETIHKAKGLEYDAVILVEEESRSVTRSDRGITALRNDCGGVEWILEPLKQDLMSADPELEKLRNQTRAQGGFEALCRLYVAMTRARRGLYMIAPAKRAETESLLGFLQQKLLSDGAVPLRERALRVTVSEQAAAGPPPTAAVLWENGTQDWYESQTPAASGAGETDAATDAPSSERFAPLLERPRLVRPSSGKSTAVGAAPFFDLRDEAEDFGSRVHAAFQQIEWLEADAEPPPETVSEGDTRVRDTLRKCFADHAIRQLFTPHNHAVEVWRERPFTFVAEGRMINGIFDRVHLHRNENGDVQRAEIIDFKTDRLNDPGAVARAAETHRPQMAAYVEALAGMLNLKPSAVHPVLIFTHPPLLASPTA